MKYFSTLVMVLGLASVAQASDLNQNALNTLLNTPDLTIEGDVFSYETATSIYNLGLKAGARIENKCEVIKASKIAKCILWITYNPIGETALEYTVNLPGNTLNSNIVYVSRGD